MARHHNLSNCSRFHNNFPLAELHRTLWQLGHLHNNRFLNSQHSPKYNFPSKLLLAEPFLIQ